MDIKEDYPLNLRIGIIVTLILFIVAFLVVPKQKVKAYKSNFTPKVHVEKLPPQLKNIVEPPPPPKPKLPVAAKTDQEVQQQTIQKTNFTGFEKETEVLPAENVFVPFEKAPVAFNFDSLRATLKYPEIAKKLGIEGTVYLHILVDKEGRVRKVKIQKRVYPALDQAALAFGRKLRFTPALQRDKPVAVWVSIPVTFHLHE